MKRDGKAFIAGFSIICKKPEGIVVILKVSRECNESCEASHLIGYLM
jgi:hypothetical protein